MSEVLPRRISKRYDVSLLSEADDGNSGEVLIVDSFDRVEYRGAISGDEYKDLRVLLSHGSEAHFDKHVDVVVQQIDNLVLYSH